MIASNADVDACLEGGSSFVCTPSIPPRLVTASLTPTLALAGLELTTSTVKERWSLFPLSTKNTGSGDKLDTNPHPRINRHLHWETLLPNLTITPLTYRGGALSPSLSSTTRSQFPSSMPCSKRYEPRQSAEAVVTDIWEASAASLVFL